MPLAADFVTDRQGADDLGLRGSNQSGMRDHNERLVLSLLRQHGALAKSDIARITGLSAQTISVIMRALEQDGLLLRGEPVRGRIGQPSVPMHLNPEGALFLGLKIGREPAKDLSLPDPRRHCCLCGRGFARVDAWAARHPAPTGQRDGCGHAIPAVELGTSLGRAAG
jgi:DNA-binding transcriptional ArsR family regulator